MRYEYSNGVAIVAHGDQWDFGFNRAQIASGEADARVSLTTGSPSAEYAWPKACIPALKTPKRWWERWRDRV